MHRTLSTEEVECLNEQAKKATPEVHIPARFAERARLDRLDWIAKSPAGRRALEHCRRFVQDPEHTRGPLLVGPAGCGKTSLLLAIARGLQERAALEVETVRVQYEAEILAGARPDSFAFPVRRICVATGADIAHELRQSVQDRNLERVVGKYRQVQLPGPFDSLRAEFVGIDVETYPAPGSRLVLLVDDVEVSKMSDWLHEELYRIFDLRYAENLPTVIASNLGPEELQRHLGDRIARRLFDMTQPFELSGETT
jgi:DNA replication protein DnaC